MEGENKLKKLKLWDWIKIVAAIIYIISPIDLVPDFIPVAGWLDDLAVLIVAGVPIFKKLLSR